MYTIVLQPFEELINQILIWWNGNPCVKWKDMSKKSSISVCFLEIHSNRTNNEFVNINEGEIAMSSGLCKIQFVGVFIFCSSFKRELMRVSFQSFKLS